MYVKSSVISSLYSWSTSSMYLSLFQPERGTLLICRNIPLNLLFFHRFLKVGSAFFPSTILIWLLPTFKTSLFISLNNSISILSRLILLLSSLLESFKPLLETFESLFHFLAIASEATTPGTSSTQYVSCKGKLFKFKVKILSLVGFWCLTMQSD